MAVQTSAVTKHRPPCRDGNDGSGGGGGAHCCASNTQPHTHAHRPTHTQYTTGHLGVCSALMVYVTQLSITVQRWVIVSEIKKLLVGGGWVGVCQRYWALGCLWEGTQLCNRHKVKPTPPCLHNNGTSGPSTRPVVSRTLGLIFAFLYDL